MTDTTELREALANRMEKAKAECPNAPYFPFPMELAEALLDELDRLKAGADDQEPVGGLHWKPIFLLTDIYQQPIWIASPKLIHGDKNPLGISEAYWQDTDGPGQGEWRCVDFDMCNDEFQTATLAFEDVTHFLIPTGPYPEDWDGEGPVPLYRHPPATTTAEDRGKLVDLSCNAESNLTGCLHPEEHQGRCGYSLPNPDAIKREARREALPRLTEAMIRAACEAHYGDENIDGIDLTSNGINYTFRAGFKRMWEGIRALSERTNPDVADAEKTLFDSIVHGLRQRGWSKSDAENEALERIQRNRQTGDKA